MLRLLAVLLLLANGLYFAWSQFWLAPYGFAPTVQSEPARLKEQIRPDAIRLMPAAEAARLEGAPTAAAASAPLPAASAASSAPAAATATSALVGPTVCLEAGMFTEAQSTALRARLQALLAPGSWSLLASSQSSRWLVYMGKYSGLDALEKKKSELRAMNLRFEVASGAALEPGLVLGEFDTEALANADLARVTKRGVRTAKVVTAEGSAKGLRLRVPAADAAMRKQLEALNSTELLGKPLSICG